MPENVGREDKNNWFKSGIADGNDTYTGYWSSLLGLYTTETVDSAQDMVPGAYATRPQIAAIMARFADLA